MHYIATMMAILKFMQNWAVRSQVYGLVLLSTVHNLIKVDWTQMIAHETRSFQDV